MGWTKVYARRNFSPQQGLRGTRFWKRTLLSALKTSAKWMSYSQNPRCDSHLMIGTLYYKQAGASTPRWTTRTRPSHHSEHQSPGSLSKRQSEGRSWKRKQTDEQKLFPNILICSKKLLAMQTANSNSFMEDAQEAFVFSGVGLVFKKDAFHIFIMEIAQHHAKYDEGATNRVVDFFCAGFTERRKQMPRGGHSQVSFWKARARTTSHALHARQGACDLFASVVVDLSEDTDVKPPRYLTNSQLRTKVHSRPQWVFFRLWKVRHMPAREGRTLLQQQPVFDALKEAFFSHLRIYLFESGRWRHGINKSFQWLLLRA